MVSSVSTSPSYLMKRQPAQRAARFGSLFPALTVVRVVAKQPPSVIVNDSRHRIFSVFANTFAIVCLTLDRCGPFSLFDGKGAAEVMRGNARISERTRRNDHGPFAQVTDTRKPPWQLRRQDRDRYGRGANQVRNAETGNDQLPRRVERPRTEH